MKTAVALLAGILMAGSLTVGSVAGEHPEHPEGKSKEHPEGKSAEHPEKSHKSGKKGAQGSTKSISKKDMAKAIKDYVKRDSALKGGYFLVYDKKAKKTLRLTLDHVHKERLSKIKDGVYFACADFKTPEGRIYDLDVFMKGHHAKHLRVTEVSIHKEDGKARYGWVEKGGIWKKKT